MNEEITFELELRRLIHKYCIDDKFDLDSYTLSEYLIIKLEDLEKELKDGNKVEK